MFSNTYTKHPRSKKKKKNINYKVGWNNIALNMFWNQIFSFNLYVLAICMKMNASHPPSGIFLHNGTYCAT